MNKTKREIENALRFRHPHIIKMYQVSFGNCFANLKNLKIKGLLINDRSVPRHGVRAKWRAVRLHLQQRKTRRERGAHLFPADY